MAEFTPMMLVVEFDKEKVDALDEALVKMHETQREARDAIVEARDALYDLRNSMSVRRETD